MIEPHIDRYADQQRDYREWQSDRDGGRLQRSQTFGRYRWETGPRLSWPTLRLATKECG